MARRDQFWQGGHGEVGRGLLRRGKAWRFRLGLAWYGMVVFGMFGCGAVCQGGSGSVG